MPRDRQLGFSHGIIVDRWFATVWSYALGAAPKVRKAQATNSDLKEEATAVEMLEPILLQATGSAEESSAR